MKYIGVNLQSLQFVHRSETSTLNVLKTTVAHKSNKIIIMLKKKESLNKVRGIFLECASFKRRHRL